MSNVWVKLENTRTKVHVNIKRYFQVPFCPWSDLISLLSYILICSVLCHFSCVWLFSTPWTIAHQAPLSMGFPRQESWSGLPFPTPGDLPGPRDEIRVSYISYIDRWALYHQRHLGSIPTLEHFVVWDISQLHYMRVFHIVSAMFSTHILYVFQIANICSIELNSR